MADALISLVLEQLSTYVLKEAKLTVGVRQEVGKLTTTLKILQAVLDDAEEKQGKNKAVKAWLEELRDISYDADDVLDEWQTRTLTSQTQRVDVVAGFCKKVLSYLLSPFSCFMHVSVRYDIGHRIEEISERLDAIAAMKEQYGLQVIQRQEEPRQQTSSIVDVSEVRGRDHDKDVIMSRLLSESSHQGLSIHVISIVGMGGFGKTTLAKLIFNEENVIKTFEKKMWVCVSQPFDQIAVAKAIIEEAKENVPVVHGWEALHQCLCNSIKGKKFLLVLDDIWTDDPNDWSQLKLSLDGGAPGSRIIVTTRNEDVAKMMGSIHIHNLGKLSDEDSWSLLKEVALKGREQDLEKFEQTGKEIALKCKGVPLAIKTLASLLFQKRSKQDWRDVLASDLWEVDHIEKGMLPSFFLSYHSLPSSSKQCFMYCAIFPKDTVMYKDDLVKLWMAQGFLGSGGLRELEKIGRNYFDNLAMRSFFQDFEKDSDGNITSCKMHDLVHDFVQFLTQDECSIMEMDDTKFDGKKLRHLCTKKLENLYIYEAKNLRSLISPVECWLETPTLPIELFEKLECLRALDLSYRGLEKLPNEVEKLLHLRYLDLSRASLLELPETISNLYNLQTLKLNKCRRLCKLLNGIGTLSNLRHLEIRETEALSCLPRGISRLSFLRTLSKFIVGGECKIGDLKHLSNLEGDLEIMGLELISDVNEAAQVEMKKRKNIRTLVFSFNFLEGSDVGRMKDVLEKLEPHENLERLDIKGYPCSQFPYWMENSSLLSNIVNMKLYGCSQCTELPSLGKLASLESLVIRGLSSVKQVGIEFYGFGIGSSSGVQIIAFPKLKTLLFEDMEEWDEWELPISKDTKIMPSLCKLSLSNCPKLRELQGLGKLESLEYLYIYCLDSVKRVGLEFLGISNDDVDERESLQQEQIIFPKLRELKFESMEQLEEWVLPYQTDRIIIMPYLGLLRISQCQTLRTLPDIGKFKSLERLELEFLTSMEKLGEREDFIFPLTLKFLRLEDCPELRGIQPCLPPVLENLTLWKDTGIFSKSLSECSIRYVTIGFSPHSSLPKGFNQLKAVQKLQFFYCEFLDFELKELEHHTMLQDLCILHCPLLKKRFEEGEDWRSILSHVAKITIDYEEITKGATD